MLRQTHSSDVRVPIIHGVPGAAQIRAVQTRAAQLRAAGGRHRRRRRGITAVLAMLFMVLIGVLSLGFYATVTTSMSLAKNDQKSAKALLAAESGVQFMRLYLAHVTVPPPDSTQTSSQQADAMLTNLATDLRAMLSGTNGLTDSDITYVPGSYTFSIPANTNKLVPIDSEGNGFRVTIGNVGGGISEIVCKIMGQTGTGGFTRSKGVQIDFSRQQNKSSIFDGAVAAKGKLVMQKGSIGGVPGVSADTIANITSALNVKPSFSMSGGSIGGNVGVVGSTDNASITGGTVHGTSSVTSMIANEYLTVTSAPEFPTIDTSVFAPFATNTFNGNTSGGVVLSNVRIPANSSTASNPIKFTGNATVQGILYVESPNYITFAGNTTLAGFIVVENKNTSSQNSISMTGNFSVANLPSGAAYDPLRTISGVAIVAPTTSLTMTGSADSNFRGNVIVGTFRNGGSADIMIDKGTIVAMDDTVTSAVFNGKSVKFTSTGKDNQPSTGVTYSDHFVPAGGSYLELN